MKNTRKKQKKLELRDDDIYFRNLGKISCRIVKGTIGYKIKYCAWFTSCKEILGSYMNRYIEITLSNRKFAKSVSPQWRYDPKMNDRLAISIVKQIIRENKNDILNFTGVFKDMK